MIKFDPSRCTAFPPRPYQLVGTQRLLDNPIYGLFWQMRLGKCKAVIDAACTLFDKKELDVLLVVCPAQVKDVWLNPEIGEIKKHGWNVQGYNFDAKTEDRIQHPGWFGKNLVIVTSYEFLRQQDRYGKFPKIKILLEALKGKRFWLVGDEGAFVGNYTSQNFQSTVRLGDKAVRKTLLDGTVIGNSPMEQYAKFAWLDEAILGYPNFFVFRAVHAIMGGFRPIIRKIINGKETIRRGQPAQLMGFQGQDIIDERVRPFCEYLDQTGLDLPAFIPSFISVPLSKASWKIYCQLRDEMMAELENQTLLIQHAAVKTMRLSQICAGFLGGLDDVGGASTEKITVEVGEETTKALIEWIKLRLAENPKFKLVVWCRWRPEISRLRYAIEKATKGEMRISMIYGDQKDENFLHPDHPFDEAGVIIAQPQALQFGVSLAKADTQVFLSQDYNRITRSQSEQRVQLIGARQCTYNLEVLVTGPNGERTVTHDIQDVLAGKEDLATRTLAGWKKALS